MSKPRRRRKEAPQVLKGADEIRRIDELYRRLEWEQKRADHGTSTGN